jgi:hypothetical protein
LEEKLVRAGSPHASSDWNSGRVSGKAVASSGPLSCEKDHRDGLITVPGETGGVKGNLDGYINLNNDPEDGEAVGCRGVAKLRTQRNTNNPAAMLDVADGSPNTPPLLITDKMRRIVLLNKDGLTKVVLGDESEGLIIDKDFLNNCNTLHPSCSSFFLPAFNAHTNFNVG